MQAYQALTSERRKRQRLNEEDEHMASFDYKRAALGLRPKNGAVVG